MRLLSVLVLLLTPLSLQAVEITQLGMYVLRPVEQHHLLDKPGRPEFPTSYWNWTQPAPHHACAVQVKAGSAAGSGIWMQFGTIRGVLTAAHVTSGGSNITCIWPDGHRSSGPSTHCKYNNDVAFVQVSHPTLQPVKFSMTPPKPGDMAELIGYGGPRASMRHFTGPVIESGNDHTSGLKFDFKVMNGDSGSGILNTNHEVIGIQSVGIDQAVATRQGWPIYGKSGSAGYTSIRGFLQRVMQRGGVCGPGGCPPGGGGGGSGNGGSDGVDDLYPPPSMPPSQPSVPPATPSTPGYEDGGGGLPVPDAGPAPPTPPKEQPKVVIDLDDLADKVLERMIENPEPFRGPPGKDGSPGAPGPAGSSPNVDSIVAQVKEKLPPIKVMFEGREGQDPRVVQVPIGGELVIPPVRMDIKHPNGQRYKQQKPLGEPIVLEIVPENVLAPQP